MRDLHCGLEIIGFRSEELEGLVGFAAGLVVDFDGADPDFILEGVWQFLGE